MVMEKYELVGVTWLDACDHSEENLKEVLESDSIDYLAQRTTFGKLLKEDDYAIVLLRDIGEDDQCEITVIPRPWVIEVVKGNTDNKGTTTRTE